MARIAIGGMRHETNTFAARPTDLEDFQAGGTYPPLLRGAAMIPALAGLNISFNGFLDIARANGHQPVPLLLCYAKSGSRVTRRAFETVVGMLIEDLKAALPVDGVYLDLHGAMVAEDYDDGEGEIMRRIRELVGPGVPIIAALDYHANVTAAKFDNATAMVAYRTNPHVDKYETGARCAQLMERLLAGKPLATRAYRRLPFLVPTLWQCTMAAPLRDIMATLAALETGPVASLSLLIGFPGADVPELGPVVFGYGDEATAVRRAVDAIADEMLAREGEFAGVTYAPTDAVREAIGRQARVKGPIVLADTQDNPGGGGSSDTVAILRELMRQGARDVALVMICDPETARQAHAAGEGAVIMAALGGRSGYPGESPFQGEMKVERLGDGEIVCTGPMDRGLRLHLGPMALLTTGGIKVVVCSKKHRATDRALLAHLGLDALRQKIIVLKESTHFLSDYGAIAGDILYVEGPGPLVADPLKLPYRRLGPNIRLVPKGPTLAELRARRKD